LAPKEVGDVLAGDLRVFFGRLAEQRIRATQRARILWVKIDSL